MIIHWAALLLDIVSIAVIGALIGVLAIQEVYGHIRAVKRLFIETFSAFNGINLILLVRRIYPPNPMVAIISDRLIYSLVLFALAALGCAATIVYKKPKATTLRGTYAEILSERRLALAFLSFMS